MAAIVERVSRATGGGGMTTADLYEGATRMTVQDLIDFVASERLDPSGVYVSPEFMCYGEHQDHDKHIELSWTLSNRHPANRDAQDSQRP